MKTNDVILHGNDVSVWVADACGILIGHSQFIRAACRDNSFSNTLVSFHNRSSNRRKYFKEHSDVPLMHGDYGVTTGKRSHLHFFAIGEAAAHTFMEECDLDDLKFPAPMIGIVLIVERQTVEEFNCTPKFEYAWAQKQNFPIVIAATGYDTPNYSIDNLREQFRLEANTIVVVGSSIDLRLEQDFEPEHAKRVVDALSGHFE